MKVMQGIRVVELCQMVAGPYCTKLMADMGAEVIKVEKPCFGDAARHEGPFVGGQPDLEGSVLYLYANTSKKGITLDVRHPSGNKILRRLIGEADVFVEDNLPVVKQELGLDYESLKEGKPGLVMVSITPFGQSGPYRDYKAYPLNTFHSGGEGYLTPSGKEYVDRPPLKQGRYVGEYEVALATVVPTMAAVFGSRNTGRGCYIDMSKQEALLGFNLPELQPYLTAGLVPTRATRTYPIGGLMACKDGYVEIALHEERQWQGMGKMMGDPPWLTEERFSTVAKRREHGDEVNERLRRWMREYTKEEIFRRGQAFGCTVAKYNTIPDVVESEQMRARQFFAEVEHPAAGTFSYPTAAYEFSGERATPRPAPLLGQHNEEVLCDLLGYSREELLTLGELGVV